MKTFIKNKFETFSKWSDDLYSKPPINNPFVIFLIILALFSLGTVILGVGIRETIGLLEVIQIGVLIGCTVLTYVYLLNAEKANVWVEYTLLLLLVVGQGHLSLIVLSIVAGTIVIAPRLLRARKEKHC